MGMEKPPGMFYVEQVEKSGLLTVCSWACPMQKQHKVRQFKLYCIPPSRKTLVQRKMSLNWGVDSNAR